jgi:hypothetical protein
LVFSSAYFYACEHQQKVDYPDELGHLHAKMLNNLKFY